MKYYIMLRSRPRIDEEIPALHDRIMSELSRLPAPWGVTCTPWPKARDPGDDDAEAVILRKCFGKTIRVLALYQHRGFIANIPESKDEDDWFTFEFDVGKVDYPMLLDTALPRYVEVMRAYRAQLMPYDAMVRLANQAAWPPFRRGVNFIASANFFDREMCRQAFGLSPEQVLSKLEGRIAEARIMADGIYFIASRDVLDPDESWELDARLKPLLPSPPAGRG